MYFSMFGAYAGYFAHGHLNPETVLMPFNKVKGPLYAKFGAFVLLGALSGRYLGVNTFGDKKELAMLRKTRSVVKSELNDYQYNNFHFKFN